MRILLINNYHYQKGGADNVYFNTAELLRKKGHDVFFFSANHPLNTASNETKYFTTFHDYRNSSLIQKIKGIPPFIYDRKAHSNLLLLIDEVKPDIAHIHLFMGGLSSSILTALKARKIPIIQTVHDYRLLCPAFSFTDGENNICELCKDKSYIHCLTKKCSEKNLAQSTMLTLDAYFRKYIIKPVNLIDQFIFVSQFSMNKHIEFQPKFNNKAVKLFNFNPHLNTVQSINSRGNYFLYYGRISIEKGLDVLIKAATKANILLKIVGTGPLFENYKNSSSDNVSFLGYKHGKELWELVANASFVVVPSIWYENNPLTIVEAYSFGKPVIGSKIGGIPEIIDENKTGYLFEMGNHEELAIVLEKAKNISDLKYNEMSKNARQFAETHFNPDIHYYTLIKIYNNIKKLIKKS
jgi:glycosyltransferase involved in cell wall biosynthesis